jgi:hypothetical protein
MRYLPSILRLAGLLFFFTLAVALFLLPLVAEEYK